MTGEEELVRSTVTALADTVTQIRPLLLTTAPSESTRSAPDGSPFGRVRIARRVPPEIPVRLDGGSGPRLGLRWRIWGTPIAAAAVVIALAIALVIFKGVSNGGRVAPAGPAHSAAPPRSGSVPRYFAELTPASGRPATSEGLLVGDTFTGQTVATVTPPAGTSFLSVSAAADDRTFAVFAAPVGASPRAAGWWYLLRLAPGTSSPARLTRAPVKPLSDVAATALSGSGRELAIGRAIDEKGTPWLGIYSVTTGKLLRSWSTRSAPFRIEGFGLGLFPTGGNPQSSALTWTQSDQAITFLSGAGAGRATLRRLDIAADGSDIVKDSQVIWSSPRGCASATRLISADGKTVTCVSNAVDTVGKAEHWTVQWLSYHVAPPTAPHVLFEANASPRVTAGLNTNTLWISASGDVMLVEWTLSGSTGQVIEQHFGIVSHGTFTPLRIPPKSDIESFSPLIAW